MAEALVGGAFLSATLQVLFDRLASRPVLDFIRGRKFSDALLNKLKRKLLAVNIVLNDAEEKQITNEPVKAWLDDLKVAVYVADDILDEIATEALRSKLEAEESDPGSDQVWNVSSTSLTLFDEEMQSRIEEILDRLENRSQEKDVLGLKQLVGGNPSQRLATTSLVDESNVYGRDGDKEKIIEFLLSDDASGGHEIGVVTIVGMGGLGKTTLAQLVYNDSRMKDCFNLKAWVCVSDQFDVLRVTKTILEAITRSTCDSNDLNFLQVRLKESLSEKKFLLILDDVWNENYNDWDSMRGPFRYGAKGSKIIVTTRSDNVASIMGRGPTHRLNQLLDEDCWLLFAKHAFDNSNNSSKLHELEVIGKKIVKKCKGIPLAVKTLGGLLRSKADVEDWYKILRSKLWELSNDKSSILPALRLSYHYLPSQLKCCFAYCSIFPKDYEFEKQQVVLLWMAEGFLQGPHRNEKMEEIGNMYFHDLISRSLFQGSSMDKSRFVMHDLVNDLAKYVSGDFCFRLEKENLCEIPEKTRHLSYSRDMYNASREFKALNNAKALRTLLPLDLSMNYCSFTDQIPRDILPSLRCLRALSLSQCHNIRELPDSLGGLKHLRYLDLSNTAIRKLPDSTSTLCNLQTVLLRNCECLIELPANMRKLINLRHLDVSGTKLKEMPMHMSRLINLQTLSTFIVGKHEGQRIKELRELNGLQGAVNILNLENVVNAGVAKEGNMKDKVHIEELQLQWSIDIEDSQTARDVLERLQPHTKLKKLTIDHYGGTRFPDWLGDHSFSNMVCLCLRNCKYCLFLPPVGQLPSLRELSIDGFDGVQRVGPEFYGNDSSATKRFKCLENLTFKNMPELEEWFCSADEGAEFACLRQLNIVDCPKLYGVLPDHLPCLTTLELENCDKLVLFSGNDDVKNLQSCPCLKTLEISNMSGLKELPPRLQQSLFAIKDVSISGCLSLESLPMSDLPTTLKYLRIETCPKLDLVLPEPDDEIQIGLYSDASLKKLIIWNSCDSLKSFPLGLFPKLQYLSLCKCINMESLWIPEGVHEDYLTSLLSLTLLRCPKLESFPKGMHNLLPSLQYLHVSDCPELESFPEEGLPSKLRTLEVSNCAKLTARRMEWGLQRLPNLKTLTIGARKSNEVMVESFPEEGLLPSSLTSLSIISFSNLKYLNQRGFQHLSYLEKLCIWNCSKLQCLPEEGLPNSLSLLKISGCPLLQQWCQREKGEGWPKIAHIPNIVIHGELIS